MRREVETLMAKGVPMSTAYYLYKNNIPIEQYKPKKKTIKKKEEITEEEAKQYYSWAGFIFSQRFGNRHHLREDLIQEAVLRLIELSGQITNASQAMIICYYAMLALIRREKKFEILRERIANN